MAAFTNPALSASHRATRYLNQIFIIERGQYTQLGLMMITTALLALVVPILTVMLFRRHRGRQHRLGQIRLVDQPQGR